MSSLTKLMVSPHIHGGRSTSGIMMDVLFSLLPATVAGTIIFGLRSLLVVAICVACCVGFEYLFNLIAKTEQTIGDLSAAVTGLLLALNLPVNIPLWQCVIGSLFAIVVVKCLFGGIGKNLVNPAITARVFMLVAFSSMAIPSFPVDSVSKATPLDSDVMPSLLDLFLGNHGGAIGETCAVALLLGGVYLIIRRVISWHIPVAFIGTVFVFSFLMQYFAPENAELKVAATEALALTLSGGVFIGAFFMATDYTTSPSTPWGKIIFGLGAGVLTCLIRKKFFGSYPEGVSFAILFMNIITPYICRWTRRKVFTAGGQIMNKNVKNLIVFICICSVITILLATTNFITEPIITENQNAAANQALLDVMPDGKGFENLDITKVKLPATVTEAYKESDGQGYVFKLTTSGYGPGLVIMCGVDSKGVVTGAKCLASNETLGKEKTYGESFKGKDVQGVEAVDTVATATITTSAYKNAIKDALNAAIVLGGGSVDIRTEEEILADNLNSALPEGEKKFQKVFLTEKLTGVDAVYIAENQTGYVAVSGEKFVGIKADGTVVGEGIDDPTIFTAAVETINSSTLTDIDFSSNADLQQIIVKAQKTASGNFVIDAKGAGYGIKGGDEYHPASGEYIIVRLTISPDFEIIDCLTVSQAETKGIGDACEKESFYGQFIGKNETNYTEIDAIGGATLTTNGYKQAIERAIAAVKVLKGGAN